MPTSKVTSRGQTTIPKPIRESLGLRPGDRVEFLAQDGHVVLRRAGSDVTELDGLLADLGGEPATISEMEAAIRAGAERGSTLS